MADTPVVAGPVPLWYTAACQTRQFNPDAAGGWGDGKSVFSALAAAPATGLTAEAAYLTYAQAVADGTWVYS